MIDLSECSFVKEVKNLDTGEVFRSAREAAEKCFLHPGNIQQCCTGLKRTAGGYRWEYTGNTTKNKTSSRAVKNLDTGEVFGSIKAAGENYNIRSNGIWKCCRGKVKQAGGFRWRYAYKEEIDKSAD